jgi:hypothetical protein
MQETKPPPVTVCKNIPDSSIDVNKVEYIEGPISLYELYDEKYNKHMYLFGDYHPPLEECDEKRNAVRIADFLKNLFLSNPNKHFDFFLEESYLPKKYGRRSRFPLSSSYIGKVARKFIECFEIDKSECKYKNVRFHYADIRSSDEIECFITINNYSIDSRKTVEHFIKHPIKDFDTKMMLYFAPKLSPNYDRILKQIQKCEDPKVKEIAHEFLNKAESLIIFPYEFAIIRRILRGEKIKDSHKIMDELSLKMLRLSNAWMDTYLLSRMYRTFRQTPDKYSESPKNIIVYAGEQHISDLVEVLTTKMGIKLIQKQNINGNISDPFVIQLAKEAKCIDLTKFKRPLFDTEYLKKEAKETKGSREIKTGGNYRNVNTVVQLTIIIILLIFIIVIIIFAYFRKRVNSAFDAFDVFEMSDVYFI